MVGRMALSRTAGVIVRTLIVIMVKAKCCRRGGRWAIGITDTMIWRVA